MNEDSVIEPQKKSQSVVDKFFNTSQIDYLGRSSKEYYNAKMGNTVEAPKSNTTLYIAIGVALLIGIGGFVYLKKTGKI